MFRIAIVGAGQLGSRHLQALKAVKHALEIWVIDPSEASLKVAKERYEAIAPESAHKISFSTSFELADAIDVAVVATNSNVRRRAIESLLAVSRVNNLVLEKLLFTKRDDYAQVDALLSNAGVKTWVNCPMRVMHVYEQIKANLSATPISYRVTGSQFGLVTNAIHYLDHAVQLCGCDEFELDTRGLDPLPIQSKRPGFLELNGTLSAYYKDGSRIEITCHASGSMPVLVEIFNETDRYIVRESEGKLWHASERSQWTWQEQAAPIPYQSQLTTRVVESLLDTGECGLTPFANSSRIHLRLMDPLLEFVRSRSPETVGYPFT